MNTLCVAVVSSRSKWCDVAANLDHFERLIGKAVKRGARLVCFPELALTSYTLDPKVLDVAEKLPGPATARLSSIASANDVYISAGIAERSGRSFHIAQVVISPHGYLGKFRKNQLTNSESAAGFSPGRTFPFFDIDGFRMGVNICFDGRHEETLDALIKKKVDLIHHPHGNTLGLGRDAEEWTRGKLTYFVSRAVRSRAYILIHNSAGDTMTPTGICQYGSGALVVDPLGQAIARTTQKTRSEKMVLAEIRRLDDLVPEFERGRLHMG